MKETIFILIVVIILSGGYFLFKRITASPEEKFAIKISKDSSIGKNTIKNGNVYENNYQAYQEDMSYNFNFKLIAEEDKIIYSFNNDEVIIPIAAIIDIGYKRSGGWLVIELEEDKIEKKASFMTSNDKMISHVVYNENEGILNFPCTNEVYEELYYGKYSEKLYPPTEE